MTINQYEHHKCLANSCFSVLPFSANPCYPSNLVPCSTLSPMKNGIFGKMELLTLTPSFMLEYDLLHRIHTHSLFCRFLSSLSHSFPPIHIKLCMFVAVRVPMIEPHKFYCTRIITYSVSPGLFLNLFLEFPYFASNGVVDKWNRLHPSIGKKVDEHNIV